MATLGSPTILAELGSTVAKNFRLGYEGASHALLVEFIDALVIFLEKSQLAQDQYLAKLLAEMLEAQKRRDHLFVADIIQYELLTRFDSPTKHTSCSVPFK